MESINIAGRIIGPRERPYIIAEIGANHNGDMGLCRQLIDAAKECGVDAVKFQSWSKRSLISRPEFMRNAQYANGASGDTLEKAVEKYQLSNEQHYEITEYCQKKNITAFSSCFSTEEVDLLERCGTPAYKIASMDLNYLGLLEYIAAKRKPIILSTGLGTLGEIERALSILQSVGAEQIALLHCLSIYPSPAEIVNLRNIGTLERAFDVPVGYSDHCLGNSVALASVAVGACIIEKHFTLDKSLPGWDHAISADPKEMAELVQESANVHAALGRSVRTVNSTQLQKREIFRRRLVLKRSIRAGEKVQPEHLEFKRPGTGINPDEVRYVVGRTVQRDLEAEAELDWADLA